MSEQARQVRVLISPQKPSGQTLKQMDPFRKVFTEQAVHSFEDVLHLLHVELQARQALSMESSKNLF